MKNEIQVITKNELSEKQYEKYKNELEFISDEYFSDNYSANSGNDGSIFLLKGKKVIGGIFTNYDDLQYDDDFWKIERLKKTPYIFDIYILEKERQKGYSKLLLDVMIKDFVKNYPLAIKIKAEVHNLDLAKSLKKYGFYCIDAKRQAYHSTIYPYYAKLVLTNLDTNEDYTPKDCVLTRRNAIKYLKDNNIRFMSGGNVLLAPNGKPSNLNPEQYRLVRTPAFKNWFGDWENSPETASKVVDENGEPLICYHGTTKYFNEFNYSENATNDFGIEGRGHYFSNEKGIAIQYAKRYIKELKDFDSTNGRVIEVFLKINNPASRKETSVLMSKYKDFETNARETQKELINKGFNGVIKKYPSGDNSYEFIVFESTQIKLADGTNTTFDGNNPDIRFKDGGYIGSCVDVGSGKKEVCKYFPDATIMAQYVGNPDENDWGKSKETTSEEFYKFVSKDDVPKKAIIGEHTYHYISEDSYGRNMNINETAIYFIYNADSDIHYFFKKTKFKNGGLTTIMNLAPNGKPSNLTPEQYRLVRTPAFKKWFGDWEKAYETSSKVVDENGEPLVVYHGSNDKITTFNSDYSYYGEFWFSRNKEKILKGESGASGIKYILPCFLNIRKLAGWDEYQKLYTDERIQMGFLGTHLDEDYIAYYPNQIKLADGSNTTFDSNNDDIRFMSGGNVLLAPNGKPSNLTLEQYRLVRTPAFKKWFGDWENSPETASKIVDINGEPLVCYHGSNKKNISIFDIKKLGTVQYSDWGSGFYFTPSKSTAHYYSAEAQKKINKKYNDAYEKYGKTKSDKDLKAFQNVGRKLDNPKNPIIYEVFLDIKSPYREIVQSMSYTDPFLSNYAKEKLKDGILIMRNYNPTSYDELIVFQPNQIKLADGSNTTFDGSNPDIRFSGGGSLSESDELEHIKNIKTFTLNESDYNSISNSDTVDKFNYLLSKLGINIKVVKKLGKGKLGYAFLTDNGNVVKLTDNKQEALASFIFLNHKNNLKTQAKIFNVLQFVYNQSYFYLIEREYIKDVVSDLYEQEKYKEFIDYVFGYAQENIPYRNKKTDENLQVLSYKYYDSMLSYAKEIDNVFYSYLIENKDEFINKTFQIFVFYRDVVSDISLTGVRYNDVHYGNLGFHNNKLICFDCISTDSKNINSTVTFNNGGGISIPDLLSSQEVADKLGRELHWWKDDMVYLSGIKYKKVYLRPEYKRVIE